MPKSKQQQARSHQGRASGDKDDFKTVAARLECDTDKGRFEAKLGKIAKPKARGDKVGNG